MVEPDLGALRERLATLEAIQKGTAASVEKLSAHVDNLVAAITKEKDERFQTEKVYLRALLGLLVTSLLNPILILILKT